MSDNNYHFHRGMLNELKAHSGHLTTHSSHLEILKDVVIELNNNEIGDAQDGLRVFPFSHDSANGKGRALFSDASHNLKVKDDDLLIEATTSNTKLTTIETDIETTNTKLTTIDGVLDNILVKNTSIDNRIDLCIGDINNTSSIGDGSSQFKSMCLGYDRSNSKGRSILVDADGKIEVNDGDVKDKLTGGTTSSSIADILELLLFNAQQTTQSIVISAMNIGITTTYNLQKYNKVSVIIKETLNTPSNTAYAQLEWSDNDDIFVSYGTRQQFTFRTRADGSTTLGYWATFEATPVLTKYMRVCVYNGDMTDSHTYDVDVNFQH